MSFRNSLNKKFTQQLNEIINSNIHDERFGVSELAYELNMSRCNLYRRIKAVTGDSVSQYLRKVRLNKAMELLNEQYYTISEVAYKVGFASVNYFSKCFKDQFGYPPSDIEIPSENFEDSPPIEDQKSVLKNFPVQTTSFIGRETEINTILDLLKKYRMVSLVGTGGCGKTRLAFEVVSKLEKQYKDGIWFVNLAPVESEELVVKELLNTLKIAEVPGKIILEVLSEKIKDKKLLLLLDNCEHVLAACAEVAAKLIQVAPGLSIIATSRKALNINGEKVWLIPPLSLVDPSTVSNLEYTNKSEAVRLFADRALLNNPGFRLVNENSKEVALVCQKVDGIPLAVELVASRTRYMDVSTMILHFDGRLAEIPSIDPRTAERHKTLEATIEWSYNLLNEEEKVLYRSLSIFTGGFDLNAVEGICSSELLQKEKILDILSNLIDSCLVQTFYTEDRKLRYTMLETLRQHGLKILSEKQENHILSRKHVEYFTSISDQAYDEKISKQAHWIEKLKLEHNNMLAALRWAEHNEPALFSRLAANLSWFWEIIKNYSIALRILERIAASEPADKVTQARFYTGYGSVLFTFTDFQKALGMLKHGVSLWRELKNKKEESFALAILAALNHNRGDVKSAMKYAREGYKLAMQLNEPSLQLYSKIGLITGLVFLKKTQEARPMVEKAIKMAKEQQNLFLTVISLNLLGDCGLIDGKYHESERDFGLSIKAAINYGDTSYTCMQITSIAMAVAGQGRLAKALRLNAAATKIAMSFEHWVPEEIPAEFWQELIKQHIVGARNKLGEKITLQTEEEGRAMSLDEAVEYALNFKV